MWAQRDVVALSHKTVALENLQGILGVLLSYNMSLSKT